MAYQFDGSNDALTYTDIAAFDGLAHCTYACWYYPVTWVHSRAVLGKGYTCFSVGQYQNDQNLIVQVGASPYGYTAATSFPNTTWHHIAAVYDGTLADANRIILYKNGAVQAFTTTALSRPTTLAATATVFALGNDYAGVYGFGNIRLAHVKVWAASLTPEEIGAEMLVRRPQRTANLLLWLPLEAVGADYAQPSYAVTVVDAPVVVADPPLASGAPVLVM